ncbi:MAG: aminopeptidase, partial [Hyphococcus sp.]
MRRSFSAIALLASGVVIAACSRGGDVSPGDEPAAPPTESSAEMEAVFDASIEKPVDRFTYSNYDEVRVSHLHLDLTVDFAETVLEGVATLSLDYLNPNATTLILDTNDLTIERIEYRENGSWARAEYTLGEDDAVLGSRLEIALADKPGEVRITYKTSPTAEGLQWLSPAQTEGKEHPFLFSQNQTIFARTMAPLQDTPAVRMTYSATLRTPEALLALMSAEQDAGPRDGEYEFDMPQPVPSYLLAVAVGNLSFKSINDHIGVYAEDYILDAAAAEFEDTPQMEVETAALYGPYRWGRYDLLVLPPSFPFGGMENPR